MQHQPSIQTQVTLHRHRNYQYLLLFAREIVKTAVSLNRPLTAHVSHALQLQRLTYVPSRKSVSNKYPDVQAPIQAP